MNVPSGLKFNTQKFSSYQKENILVTEKNGILLDNIVILFFFAEYF